MNSMNRAYSPMGGPGGGPPPGAPGGVPGQAGMPPRPPGMMGPPPPPGPPGPGGMPGIPQQVGGPPRPGMYPGGPQGAPPPGYGPPPGAQQQQQQAGGTPGGPPPGAQGPPGGYPGAARPGPYMNPMNRMPPPPVPSMKRPAGGSPAKPFAGQGGGPMMGGMGGMPGGPGNQGSGPKRKKKLADKILPQKVRDLVPESQAYMDLLAFERKLDFTITRKRLDIQESLKRPMKQKRKLRIFISNTFYPSRPDPEASNQLSVPSWELRVEGRLLEDPAISAAASASSSSGSTPGSRADPAGRVKRKFSSFFKSLVIELDKDLYGPDNHLVEWHRTPSTQETDGFQVKRPGEKNVRCTILLLLDYQPLQFKLDPPLARILGIHTQTRPVIISALWQYIKTHRLQDTHEREWINCDKYLEQIFQTQRMKFAEIPSRLTNLLHPPDPIAINHLITVEGNGTETKKTSCYDIDVEIDDPLRNQMQNFLLSSNTMNEIQGLDNKIHETVDTINQLKTNREFFLSFAADPQQFIHKWLLSQMQDLKTMTDQSGNPEEERLSQFFYQSWTQEAVCRYFYGKVQQRRFELEQSLNIR